MNDSSIDYCRGIQARVGNEAIGDMCHAIDEKNVTDFIVKSMSTGNENDCHGGDLRLPREYCLLAEIAYSNITNVYSDG